MKLKFSFVILILCLLFAINKMFVELIVYLCCLLIHEYTHILTANKLGYQTSTVYLTPFGATVNLQTETFYKNHQLIIALSAPLLNLFLLVLTVAIWWLFPQSYHHTYYFALSNFALCFFNLLPIYPLDGSKVLSYFLSKKTKNINKIFIIINIISGFVFITLSIILKNFSYALMAILFILSLFEKQSITTPYIFNKFNPNSNAQLNTIIVGENVKLYQLNKMLAPNKLNRFFVVNQNLEIKKVIYQHQLINLFENNSSLTKLNNLK